MKQYLTPDQTAKLVELGFEKPKNTISKQVAKRKIGYGILEWEDAGEEGSYSIGELIEMLPEKVTDKYEHDAILQMTCFNGVWRVKYAGAYDVGLMLADEMIDALYYMLINLLENDLIHLKSNEGTKDK